MSDRAMKHWLASLGLTQYEKTFQENDIDLRALSYLSDIDLKDLGVSLGHRRILLKEVQKRTAIESSENIDDAENSRPAQSSPERRQLSVMFCDIVGSTELVHLMDPEDMRDVLRRYQDEVGNAVRKYNGYVARFFGDGILAYFGWPRAFEDQAERSIRAGLEATRSVAEMPLTHEQKLQVRIGIDTGEVVVGDLIGLETTDDETVTGLVPNLAARLQTAAAPGQVVIGENTRNLVGNAFTLSDLGPQTLKGFPQPINAWAVTGERQLKTRYAATRGRVESQLVGRGHELGILEDRWNLASENEGQVVLLSGEAGIGKSKIVSSFVDGIPSEYKFLIFLQCSPYHTSSAFHPVVSRLLQIAGISPSDTNDVKLSKLESMLETFGQNTPNVGSIMASLLSISGADKYGALDITPQQFRQRTVDVLTDQMLQLAKKQSVLCVVEDAHWIDPSTEEFLSELIPRITNQRIFLLMTYRPEKSPQWSSHPHVTAITLSRLGRKQATQIAHGVGGVELLDAIIERILRRADGIPLFIEELTKTVKENYSLSDDSEFDDLIPATLQSSLIARLDHLDDAKDVAQIGAVIGREFDFQLISQLADIDSSTLESHLTKLIESGLVYVSGKPPEARYTFKHALIQDAAYNTILIKRRRELHQRIVDVMETADDETSLVKDATLAHHAYQARNWNKAFTSVSGGRAKIHGSGGHQRSGFAVRASTKSWSQPSRNP